MSKQVPKRVPEQERYCASHIARHTRALEQWHLSGLTADDCAEPGAHAVIAVAEDLQQRGETVSPETIRHTLKQKGVWDDIGGQEWWSGFIGRSGDGEAFETYANDIRAASTLRDVSEPVSEMARTMNNGHGPREALEGIGGLTADLLRAQADHQAEVMRGGDLAGGVREMLDGEHPLSLSLPMGFPGLDAKIDGLHVGRVNVIAGRSDHGKSSYTDQIVLNVARRWVGEGKRVVKFDLENSDADVKMRLASNLSGVPIRKIKAHAERKTKLNRNDYAAVEEAAQTMAELPISIDTTTGADSTYMRSRVLAEQAEEEVGLVIADYLTQMGEKGDGPMEKVMNGMSGLHALAKDLDVPVVAVSQINRQPMSGGSPEPQLHHMAWSDDVAQVPAQVQCVFYPLAHWVQTDRDVGSKPDDSQYYVYVRKNKGPKGAHQLEFDNETLRVIDPEDSAPF